MSQRFIFLVLLAVLAMLIMPSLTQAQDKPIQISLVTPIQIFPDNYSISGIRINLIYGRNASVTGFDWGLVNHTTTGKSLGVQFGVVGLADADFVGWQNNWVNVVNGNFQGLQSAAVNYAYYANGIQFGIVNYSGSMRGVQIGLINIIIKGGAFPVFPIVNWSFKE